MFWTETIRQLGLFDGEEYITQGCGRVTSLIAFSEKHFPHLGHEFHRRFAFLTHVKTQEFLSPILVRTFGSLDYAKVPTLDWLESIGSFETFARSTRDKGYTPEPAELPALKGVPSWYKAYLSTARFRDMKSQAERLWRDATGSLACGINRRHEYECMHHADYGRLGEADEFRYLVPLCNICHEQIRVRGPSLPREMPEGVKQWVLRSGASSQASEDSTLDLSKQECSASGR